MNGVNVPGCVQLNVMQQYTDKHQTNSHQYNLLTFVMVPSIDILRLCGDPNASAIVISPGRR